jgi:hypothetical protein
MKAGPHAGEDLDAIIARKQQEAASAGWCLWGYGGSACHPLAQVRPHAEAAAPHPIAVLFIQTGSTPAVHSSAAREYSADAREWAPVPEGHRVTGSKWALVLRGLARTRHEIDLGEYQVAVGPSAGKNLTAYLRGRCDKACAVPATTHGPVTSALVIATAELVQLRPQRVRGWLNRADDDQFRAQAAAVCEVYLRPPPDTVVICIDEKTGIQARYRRYPGRLPRPGRPGRREFEYVRNRTVSIIAALHVATGQVVTEPTGRNDPVTFTGFLHRLNQCTDPRLGIHIIMDNGSSRTSKATRAWIAAHPRIKVTCTPEHASRTGLTEKITSFAIRCNRTAKPWTRACDARDDHARYRARHSGQNAAATTAQALPQVA